MPLRRDDEGKVVFEQTKANPAKKKGGSAPSDQATVLRRSAGETIKGAMGDPPVGWLVIVGGPGKGSFVKLGVGANAIGRKNSDENRVVLDYGDKTISRVRHCVVAYDQENRKFFLQHDRGTHLVYIGSEPVLSVQELKPGMHIRIGRTDLRFVPVCGPDFDWDGDG